MTGVQWDERLIDRLPEVRGTYTENLDLSRIVWFKAGGPAQVAFEPADEHDLRYFLAEKPRDVPVTVIGVGSNILVRDGGVPGVVLRLGRGFSEIAVEGTTLIAGSTALAINVARTAQREGCAGLEFLSGIPGSIGGVLRMNAGAYHRETKDVLIRARAVDPSGVLNVLACDAFSFSYRHTKVPEDWIFVNAEFRVAPGDPEAIAARMAEISDARNDSQPIRTRTGGSTFKNPEGAKAWELIDQAGCRGMHLGGAQVSEQHCNFLINTGTASAADLEALGETVRERVLQTSGIKLEWEIKRIGVPLEDGVR